MLVGYRCSAGVQSLNESQSQLLAELDQVSSQKIYLHAVSWRAVQRIERESGVSWQRKVVHGRRVENSISIIHCGVGSQSVQAVRHKQNSINKRSVGRSLDLKVLEKAVGPEQVQDLVNNVIVVLTRVRRTPELCSERQHR